MTISVFDLFAIGIGPSSSHTVGPMKAAASFVNNLHHQNDFKNVKRITIELFGSLAFTGKGHGTDHAMLLGLLGELPHSVDPDSIKPRAEAIIAEGRLPLDQHHSIAFDYLNDFIFNFKELLPQHTNGMRFKAYNAAQEVLLEEIYYSIGGGFIFKENDSSNTTQPVDVPYPFENAKTLIELCEKHGLSISELMLQNESALRSKEEVESRLLLIADVMRACIEKGCRTKGTLPGGLNVKRRAPDLYEKLLARGKPASHEDRKSVV